MSDVMREVDERSKLAGTNKFELLIFRLGPDRNSSTREVFGMNVFKVREALIMPVITPMPGSPKHVLGVANIRGQIIPMGSVKDHGSRGSERRFAHQSESRDAANGPGDARDGRVHADSPVEGRRFTEKCTRGYPFVSVRFCQRIACEEGWSGRLRRKVRSG